MSKIIPYGLPFNANLEIQKLHERARLPTKAYQQSAAYDLSACLISDSGSTKTITIAPQTTLLIPTGLAMKPPSNHTILICSRSGLGKNSIFVTNAPGVVDPDYTGEIGVLLYNGSSKPFYLKHGDRVAQALIVPFAAVRMKEVEQFPTTERGDKGFGSTGK